MSYRWLLGGAADVSVVANPAVSPNLLTHVPVTLLPTRIPRQCFEQVAALSQDWNALVDGISRDHAFLLAQLADSGRADPWLQSLLDILRRLEDEGCSRTQAIRFGVYRSDYMINAEETPTGVQYTAQQVEFNTIAAALGGLSTRVSAMHRYVLERELDWTEEQIRAVVPDNKGIQHIAEAFSVAFRQYQLQFPDEKHPVVVMVVQQSDFNIVDQRMVECALWTQQRIPVVRRTLFELSQCQLDARGQFLVAPDTPAAIFYFRAGYTPRDYPTRAEFDAIYLVEKSRAIKCPSLGTHLAGCKKIQQVLAQPGQVEKFVDEEAARRLRHCFAGLYALESDDESTKAIIQRAIDEPSSYVLKPQREGGGNNLWADDMVAALKRMTKEERAAYILMKKISPQPQSAALLRKGQLSILDCVSELGIYSAFVGDGATTHYSAFCGHLLRTKVAGVNEGGLATGVACLSSVIFDE